MNAPSVDLMQSLPLAWPELLLAAFALLAAVIGAWGKDKAFGLLSLLGVLALLGAAALAVAYQPGAPVEIFQGAMVIDGVGVFAKVLIAISAAVTLWLGADHFGRTGDKRFEFPVLIGLAVLGMFVMGGIL